MNVQRNKIKQALEALVEAQRHRDFQRLAVHLAKRQWPELQATEEQNDGGEDATSFLAGADGVRRSVAASLTGTIAKVKEDAARILGIIGRSRLEHGWPANELLHPDIELVKKLGGPWELF